MDLDHSSSGINKNRVSHGALGVVLAVHAGALFALATNRQMPPPVAEQLISVSLVTSEARPESVEAPKPLPVKSKQVKFVTKPAKKTATSQTDHAPIDLAPQLAAKVADDVFATSSEQNPAAPVVENAAPPSPPAATKVAEVPLPREEIVEPPRFNADYLNNPAPAYPALSRKLREEGRVLLRVRVDTSGQPAQVAMHQSSGSSRLDERAVETVRHWIFQPARQGGQPVEAWVIVPIQFSLKG